MKNLTLFSKIITPIILVGFIFSYIAYTSLNIHIEDTIKQEVEGKLDNQSNAININKDVIQIGVKDFENILHQNKMALLSIIYMLLVILIVLLIVILKINIKNPIDVLLEHFKSIAQGKYEIIESRYNAKEIDLLIEDVNFMTKSIETREEESKTLLALTKQNQEYIEDIISSQRNMIIINDEREILDVNDSFLKFFHEYKTLEEFKEKHECVCDYFVKEEGFVYKFDDKNWMEYILEHSKVLHKVKIYKDNQYYIYTIQAKKSDKYNRVIITMTDITELEQSNTLLEQYKKAVDAGAIVSKADKKGVITYINDKFIKISGYTKEELIGQNQNIVRSKNSPSSLFKDMWQTIQNKKIWYGDIENRKKDGTPYFVSVTLIPILDQNNNIYEYIALRYDITEQVLDKQKAQKAESAKTNFLANMSHEIRTPLNAIIGFTKLLHNVTLPSKESNYINIIDKSAHNLLGIINDILDLSKIENGSLTYEKISFDPFSEFESITNLFMVNANEKSISLVSFIDPLIPQKIIGDPLRVKQVFSNLISNAIKFTPTGGTIFSGIDLLSKDAASCTIRISVQDSGIGIPKEKQKLIFEEFSQADESTSREYGGTGLGLSISNKIIKALGSHIQVESEEGKGSRFFFDIKFETSALDDEKNITAETIHEVRSYTGKILIAEDHEINQQLIAALLDIRGVEYKFANNGNEAISLFNQEKFDLILMDINMPEKNGLEATIDIIALEKKYNKIHTPIVALTANVIEADKQKSMDIGTDEYLYKPIDEKKLDEVFLKYLPTHEKKKEEVTVDYSLEEASSNMGIDKTIVKKIVVNFCNGIDQDLQKIEEALKVNDFKEIENFSHKIKGASLNLRMDKVALFARKIEEDAINNNDQDFMKNYEFLKQAVQAVKELIS